MVDFWCKESRMYIWNKQKFDTSQKALKNRWYPARVCSRSYWRPAGPSVCVLPSLLNSTTGRPAPGIPADAALTVFFTLAVVLALNVLFVSRYDLIGHSQRWHPPIHYNILLRITAHCNFTSCIYPPDPANSSSWGWSTTVANLGWAQSRSSPMQLHRISCSNIPVLENMCQPLVFQTQSTSCMACKALTWTIWCQFGIVYRHPCKRYPRGRQSSNAFMKIEEAPCYIITY